MIGIFLCAAIVLLYLVYPASLGIFTLLPFRTPVGSPPEGFENVALQTEDGVTLQAWYRAPTNGVAIVLLHGAGGSRENVRPYAQMLAQRGYGVLAVDLRGHGESGGQTNRLGWQGTRDVGAAVNFLAGRAEVRAIGGLGLSMGGEVLLGAASHYPAMRAIAVDGATRRSLEEQFALETERPLVRHFTAGVMFSTVQLLSGEKPPMPLLQSLAGSGATRFLLIAAGNVKQEIAFNQVFQTTLGERGTLWVAPGAGHTEAYHLLPDEYAGRLISFFDKAFAQG